MCRQVRRVSIGSGGWRPSRVRSRSRAAGPVLYYFSNALQITVCSFSSVSDARSGRHARRPSHDARHRLRQIATRTAAPTRSVPRVPAPRGSPARASASAARRERTPGLRRAIGTTRRQLRLRVEAAAYCCMWLCAGTWAGGRRRSTLAACASARGAGQRPGAAAIPVGRREGGTQKGPRRARRSAGARRVPLTFEAAAAAAAAQSGLPSWRACNQHRWARREGQHDEFRAGGKEGGDGGVAMRPAAQRKHGRRVSRGRGDR